MKESYENFFRAMDQFHRLNLGVLFPEMTKADCMTLMAIDHFRQKEESGVLTVSGLAEKMHAKPPAVSRSLKSLEDRGFIARTVNKSDRRNTYVELTGKGRGEWKRMEREMADFARAVISRMDEEDMCRLIAYLDELYRVANEELEFRKIKNRKEQK